MEFYSQFEQDKYLYNTHFQNIHSPGYFVDIGAHDGITGNNTFLFEQLGWDGICFEPLPLVYEKLKTNRKCQTKQIALTDKVGKEQFFMIEGYSEMLSGLVSNYEQEHIFRINKELEEFEQKYDYIEVECSTFNKEIKNTKIDILSIDTEGSEFKIIQNINFDKYQISFLIFEMNYYNKELINLLNTKNFTLVHRTGPDLIYKNNNI
jgi:FkbM family methyltransferase